MGEMRVDHGSSSVYGSAVGKATGRSEAGTRNGESKSIMNQIKSLWSKIWGKSTGDNSEKKIEVKGEWTHRGAQIDNKGVLQWAHGKPIPGFESLIGKTPSDANDEARMMQMKALTEQVKRMDPEFSETHSAPRAANLKTSTPGATEQRQVSRVIPEIMQNRGNTRGASIPTSTAVHTPTRSPEEQRADKAALVTGDNLLKEMRGKDFIPENDLVMPQKDIERLQGLKQQANVKTEPNFKDKIDNLLNILNNTKIRNLSMVNEAMDLKKNPLKFENIEQLNYFISKYERTDDKGKEFLKEIISRHQNLLQGQNGAKVLFTAVKAQNESAIQHLIASMKVDPSATDSEGKTMMHLAIDTGNLKFVKWMVSTDGPTAHMTPDKAKKLKENAATYAKELAPTKGNEEFLRVYGQTKDANKAYDASLIASETYNNMHEALK